MRVAVLLTLERGDDVVKGVPQPLLGRRQIVYFVVELSLRATC
jgi:hypothetical protein